MENRPGRAPRLLYISAAYPPYEVPEADLAWQESVHLAERGFEVHVVTTRRDNVARPPGIHVHAVMDTWGWSELPKLWQLVRDVEPDAAMTWFLGWQYGYRAMVTTAPLLVKARRREARFVTHFSNLGKGAAVGGGTKNRIRRWVFARVGRFRYGALLPHSDRIVVLSHEHAVKLLDAAPGLSSRTELIPPPPQIHVLSDDGAARRTGRQRLGVADDAFVFTYFARMYPRKGIEMLLEAFAAVVPDLPGAVLAMIGGLHTTDAWFMRSDYGAELEALVERLGIGDRVVWSGEYDWASDDASQYLRASDVAVLPFDSGIHLHNSSLAGVVAHGLPTIATRTAGTDAELLEGGRLELIPARDRGALEAALRRLYTDQRRRAELAAGATALYEQWFSWDRATDRLVEMLLGPGGRKGVAAHAAP